MITSLKEFVQPYKSQKFGFSTEDAQLVRWNSELNEAISCAIEKGEQAEIILSVMLLEGCWKNGSLDDSDLLGIVTKIWLAIPTASPRVASSLIRTIRMLLPEFVAKHTAELERMISAKDPLIRLETVLLIKEARLINLYKSMLSLEGDPYNSEVNMNGRREFIIRNEAFDLLSRHVGNRKRKEIHTVVEGGAVAYFWDWKPLLKKL